MEFKREIYSELIKWKLKPKRKPLLLMGARQIGKTTLLKSFGNIAYDDFLYLNLEKQNSTHQIFEKNKDPVSIINNLNIIHGSKILVGKTLIVLDEIQECKDALIALKYFQEELPEIHIIGAGSLLGLSIGNDRSFPVGKVEFLDMYPLSFSEFLQHYDTKQYNAYHYFINTKEIKPIPDLFFDSFQEIFKEFILIGGMPEATADYLTHRDLSQALKIQDGILRAYELDFVKHSNKTTSTKIQQVWNSLPSQLGKENKKFIYKVIKSGARAREFEEAILWLIQAGLVSKISKIETPKIPLKAYEDISSFKLYTLETGMLLRLAGLDPTTFISGNDFFIEFKGSIAENFVAQSLKKIYNRSPYYWTSDGQAEIDFCIEHSGSCIPIEVKSGSQTKSKSMAVYKKLFDPKLRIRISNLNLNITDDLLNIPIFYSEYADRFISRIL